MIRPERSGDRPGVCPLTGTDGEGVCPGVCPLSGADGFGGAFPLPLAAGSRYPELALQLARGERPEPRLGEFRAGVVMTRFFSHLCLTSGEGGSLEPFAEELPEPIASEPGEA